jgi:hypothetical protein
VPNRRLYGAFRKAGVVGNRLVARRHFLGSVRRQPAPEIQINDKCGGFLIVTDEVAHQAIDNVKIKA